MKNTDLIGKQIRIIYMQGEPNYTDKEGVIEHMDALGQLHGTWGGLAIIPDEDTYEIIGENEDETV